MIKIILIILFAVVFLVFAGLFYVFYKVLIEGCDDLYYDDAADLIRCELKPVTGTGSTTCDDCGRFKGSFEVCPHCGSEGKADV